MRRAVSVRTEMKSMSTSPSKTILVAGDICLDVVGIPVPPPSLSSGTAADNWRLTGETRTHYLPGGAMLLAECVRFAATTHHVEEARPCLPEALSCGGPKNQPLNRKAFLEHAG